MPPSADAHPADPRPGSSARGTGAVDLRSDTLTQPDDAMRRAMAQARVGDDVLDRDPTMAELEERVAALLGCEAALWTPSGSMANVIALMTHLQRGDAFLAPEQAHVLGSELGTAAWLAQGMPLPLAHEGGPGRPSPAQVRRASGDGPYFALRTTLLCLENTHNFAGGTVTPPEEHVQLVSAARDSGLAVHLDGARLWNAAVALGVPPAVLTVGVDTVSVCLSKGLGAPVGSVLAGSHERVAHARRVRKMLGGGVRQGGVLAAAGLLALDRLPELAVDHENARLLADGLRELGWLVDEPQTNIVLADAPDPAAAVAHLAELGVRALPVAGRVRFITHRDVDADDIRAALGRMTSLTCHS